VTGLVTTGEWQHIVGTFNGTTFALYRNGVKAVETTVGSCPCSIDTSTGSLYAGTNDMSGEWFDGGVDEVAVYSSGLTQAQVQAHYDKR
jgi:hypothetical protein